MASVEMFKAVQEWLWRNFLVETTETFNWVNFLTQLNFLHIQTE